VRLSRREILSYIDELLTPSEPVPLEHGKRLQFSVVTSTLQAWTIKIGVAGIGYTLNICQETASPYSRTKMLFFLYEKKEVISMLEKSVGTSYNLGWRSIAPNYFSMDLLYLEAVYRRRKQYSTDTITKALCCTIREVVDKADIERLLYYRKVLLGIQEKPRMNKKYRKQIRDWFRQLLINPYVIPVMHIS
jgi:hypothetical protein